MPIKYTEEDIINKVRSELKTFFNFYKSDIVNYKSKTKDTNIEIQELIAKFLYDEGIKNLFDKIEVIKREIPYPSERRKGKIPNNESNRHEERYCINLFNIHNNETSETKPFDYLGKVIDYQVPLKASLNEENTGLGKIDLISKNDDHIWIIEVKTNKNTETLLRCILEISTYYQQLHKEKFLKDYNLSNFPIRKGILKQIENEGDKKEFIGNLIENLEYLKKIMKILEIEVFFINNQNEISNLVLD